MNPKRGRKTHEIALSGLLFALAMALSFVEGTLVIPGLMPGMKLGLANIVVMYALFFMGGKQALVLDLLKAPLVVSMAALSGSHRSIRRTPVTVSFPRPSRIRSWGRALLFCASAFVIRLPSPFYRV